MTTYAIMGLIVVFLVYTLLFQAKLNTDPSSDHFCTFRQHEDRDRK